MNYDKIAALITKLRKDNNLTQQDLAEKVGVSFQAVSKWERGENLPDTQLLIDLADTFNISVDELLKGEVKLSKEEKKIRALPNKKQIIVVSVISTLLYTMAFLVMTVFPDINETLKIILFVSFVIVGTLIPAFFYLVKVVFNKGRKVLSKRDERISNIVYTSCAVIFLFIGFIWGLWHPGWLIFVVGYVVVLILKVES